MAKITITIDSEGSETNIIQTKDSIIIKVGNSLNKVEDEEIKNSDLVSRVNRAETSITQIVNKLGESDK